MLADEPRCLPAQVLSNTSYAAASQGIAAALQRYAANRHPYARAADEVELAILAADAHKGAAAAAVDLAGKPVSSADADIRGLVQEPSRGEARAGAAGRVASSTAQQDEL